MRLLSRLTLIPLLALSLAGPLSAREKHTNAAARAYDSLYTQFMALSPMGMKSAEVHDLTLRRDRATFLLRNGRIFRCNPIGGRTCAVVFRGTGLFTMRPPGNVEQQQLYRFLEKDSLAEPFTDLAILFADSTAEELTRTCLFTSLGTDDPDAAKFMRSSVKLMSDEDTDGFDGAFLSTFLEGERNDLFMAQFTGPDIPVYYFRIDPMQEEEISFARKKSGLLHSYFETINQFHRQGTGGASLAAGGERAPLIEISAYQTDAAIAGNLDFRASALLTFTSRYDGYRWIPLRLYSKLQVDSVLWRPGVPAEYHRDDEQSTLWLRCPAPLTKGKVCSLQVCYHGDLLRKDELDWIEMSSSSGWYPRYGYQPAHFDLTYHFPSKYRLSSIGERVSEDAGDDVTTSRWVTRLPAGNASFNLGFFKESTVEDKRIPPVVVQMAETGHRTLASVGVSSGSHMDEQVSADIANSITFFQNVYGKCPVDKLYATEIPWMHGEAFPGLIHLSWSTFQSTDEAGSDQVFRAHEVAHQWWGIGVGFRTYHDQWLSEAFATYSGLWYMQAALHDNAKFFGMLERYKERILSNRHYLIGKGQEAGPIWLGVRTHSSETAGDYDLIIYRKGAWVLHMLRNLMIDLKTMNEDRFKAMIRDYYATYVGKKASTDDFARIVSKHFNEDMGWFFREWVYDTGIPRYRFAWKAEETPEGRYRVTCRVEQEEVPEDFKMPVPLLIRFDGDRFARVRVTVTGRRMVFDLPPMPLKPEEIEFNDLHSVLCEVKTESWD